MVTMRWWNGGPGWAGWLLMSLGMVAFWALVVIAIMALLPGVQDERADGFRRADPKDAMRALDQQLASGQLAVKAYRARCELLSHRR